MGRKKLYLSNAERQKAYRNKKPSKLSNQERLEIAKTEYEKLSNPSRNDLIYTLMANQNWSRTLATETANMLGITETIKFSAPTEQPKPETEFEELKRHLSFIGHFDDKEIRWLMTFPESWKQELKEIYEDYVHRVVTDFKEKYPEKYEEYRRNTMCQ
jgi:hypothetical protein